MASNNSGDGFSGKGFALVLLGGVALIAIVAALTFNGDSTETADGAGEAIEAEVAGETVEADAESAEADEPVPAEPIELDPEDTEADDVVAETPATTAAPTTTTAAPTTTAPTTTAAPETTTTTAAPAAARTITPIRAATPIAVAAPVTTSPPPTSAPPETTAPPSEGDTDTASGSEADSPRIREDDSVEAVTVEIEEALEDEAAVEDIAFFPGGSFSSQVIFFGNEFVRLDSESDPDTGEFSGFAFASSPDGSDWDTAPTTGLPDQGFVQSLAATDDTLLAIIEIFPDFVDPYTTLIDSGLLTNEQIDTLCDIIFDGAGQPIVVTTCDFEAADQAFAEFEDALENAESDAERAEIEQAFFEAESEFFAGEEVLVLQPGDDFYDEMVEAFRSEEEAYSGGPEQVMATSSTGTAWTTAALPDLPVDDGGFAYINSAATSGDNVAILVSIEPAFNDPFQLIIESGLLTEEELESLCGIETGEFGEPIILTACDFSSTNVETLEEVELLRIEEGNDQYDEIFGAIGAEPEARPVVLTGRIDGPFDVVDLPIDGFPNSIVGTDAGFLAGFFGFDTGPTVLASADGRSWTLVERFASNGSDTGDIQLAGNSEAAVAVVVTFDDGSGQTVAPIVLSSTDLGESWSEETLRTELFGTYPFVVGGPAGFAALLEGTVEPFDFFGPELVEVVQGDFIMDVRLNDDFGGLRTANGTVIHENVVYEEAFSNGEIPNVLRIDPATEDAIWLDPETGEVLVTFLVEDIIAAIDESFSQFDDPGFEQDLVSELWFSPDGETWILIDAFPTAEEFVSIAAVGDDEILLRVETFLTPPDGLFAFEEEGREPTDEELAALDEFFAQEQRIDWVRVPVS